MDWVYFEDIELHQKEQLGGHTVDKEEVIELRLLWNMLRSANPIPALMQV